VHGILLTDRKSLPRTTGFNLYSSSTGNKRKHAGHDRRVSTSIKSRSQQKIVKTTKRIGEDRMDLNHARLERTTFWMSQETGIRCSTTELMVRSLLEMGPLIVNHVVAPPRNWIHPPLSTHQTALDSSTTTIVIHIWTRCLLCCFAYWQLVMEVQDRNG
jgi:hypothetical protein